MNAEPVQVRVVKRFSASSERVFDAWLDPALIAQWMFGPKLREEEILRIAVNARVGDSFSFLVRRQDAEINHVGQYLEIERPRRLVFTWGIADSDSSRVTIDIRPLEAGCELTLTHELHRDWADYADRTEVGWTTMVGVLAELLDATG